MKRRGFVRLVIIILTACLLAAFVATVYAPGTSRRGTPTPETSTPGLQPDWPIKRAVKQYLWISGAETSSDSPRTGWRKVLRYDLCEWKTANQTCPISYWRNQGLSKPVLWIVDYSSSLWNVEQAVANHRALLSNIDIRYARGFCPAASGERCVQVFSADYGATGWSGVATMFYKAGRCCGAYAEPWEGAQSYIRLNEHYPLWGLQAIQIPNHEIGHAIGLMHSDAGAQSSMAGPCWTSISADEAYLLQLNYSKSREV